MIRAILADDHEVVRKGIRQVLEEKGDIQIISEAIDGLEAVSQYGIVKPDIVILDISMPVMDGLDAAKQILAADPTAKILIITMFPEEQYALRCLRAGVLGYITKNSSAEELYQAVVTVGHGHLYITAQGKDSLLIQLLNKNDRSGLLAGLSDRELQVLGFIAAGRKTKEIAESLNLGVKTVETYRARLVAKLNLHTTAELVLFAREHGLV
jgi:two-component system, NarL family, invasion response regulator UvrY